MRLIKLSFIICFTVLVSCGVAGDPTRPESIKKISN
mgnify:FL=1